MFLLRNNLVIRVEGRSESIFYKHDQKHDETLLFLFKFPHYMVTVTKTCLVILSLHDSQDYKVFTNIQYNDIREWKDSVFLISTKTEEPTISEKRKVSQAEKNILQYKKNEMESDTHFLNNFLREDLYMQPDKERHREDLLRKREDMKCNTNIYIHEFNQGGYIDCIKIEYPKYTYYRQSLNDDVHSGNWPAYCIREKINGILPFTLTHYIVFTKNEVFEYKSRGYRPILELNEGSTILNLKVNDRVDEILIFYSRNFQVYKCKLYNGRFLHEMVDSLIEDTKYFNHQHIETPVNFISPYDELWTKEEELLSRREKKKLNMVTFFYCYIESCQIFQLLSGYIACVLIYTMKGIHKTFNRILKCYLFLDNMKPFKVFKLNILEGEVVIDVRIKRDVFLTPPKEVIILQTTYTSVEMSLNDITRLHQEKHSLVNIVFNQNYSEELEESCFDLSRHIEFTNQLVLFESIGKVNYEEVFYEAIREFLITGFEYFHLYLQKGEPYESFEITEKKLDDYYLNDDMEIGDMDEIEVNEERQYHHIIELNDYFLKIFYIRKRATSIYYLVIPLENDFSIYVLEITELLEFLHYPLKKSMQECIFEVIQTLREEYQPPTSRRFVTNADLARELRNNHNE